MFGKRHVDQRFAHFCRTGDPGALGDVFDGTAARLLRVAMWLVGNRADADDVLQRTFVQAIEQRERFEAGRPVLPWLIGLLGNQAAKVRRERARRALPVGGGADDVRDPEVEASARELQAAVQSVGDRLGAPYREVLALHLQQGLNAKEIAQRLERPAGTVRTQLMRALELLRQRLPVGFVGGFAAVGPMELAPLRSAVLSAAGSVAAAPAVAGSVLLGGAVVAKQVWWLVVPLAVLAGGVVWLAQPDLGSGGAHESHVVARQAAIGDADDAAAGVNGPAPVERLTAAAAAPPAAPAVDNMIAVTVMTESGLPVPNAQVAVYGDGSQLVSTNGDRTDGRGRKELRVAAQRVPRNLAVRAHVTGAKASAPVIDGRADVVMTNLGWIEVRFLGEGKSGLSLYAPGVPGPAHGSGPAEKLRRYAVGLGHRFWIVAGDVALDDVQGPVRHGEVVTVDVDDRTCIVRGRLLGQVSRFTMAWIQDGRCIEQGSMIDPAAAGFRFEFGVLRRAAPCTIGIVAGAAGWQAERVEASGAQLDLGDIVLEPLSLLGTVRATAGGKPLERAPWIRSARLGDGTPLLMNFARGIFVVTDAGAEGCRVESLPFIAEVTMTVGSPGFAEQHVPLSGGRLVTLNLERGGNVEVRVHQPQMASVAGVYLERLNDRRRIDRRLGMPLPGIGSYSNFEDVPPGRYRLVSPDGEVIGGDDINVLAGSEQRVHVTFQPRQPR